MQQYPFNEVGSMLVINEYEQQGLIGLLTIKKEIEDRKQEILKIIESKHLLDKIFHLQLNGSLI